MNLSVDILEKRIKELEASFLEADAKRANIIGQLQEAKIILQYLKTPEETTPPKAAELKILETESPNQKGV